MEFLIQQTAWNLLLRTRCVLTVGVGYDSKLIGEVEAHNMLGMLELEETH